MWNERYVKANKLPTPKEWQDLAKAPYFDHVVDRGAVALRHHASHDRDDPAGRRLGQGLAHDQGNRPAISAQVTERSFGVPEAVNSGQVGYGIVIDFFAFSSQAAGFPVKFVYPIGDDASCRPMSASSPMRRTRPAPRPSSSSCSRPPGQEVLLRAGDPPPAGQARRSTPRRRPTIPTPSRTRACRRMLTFNADLSEKPHRRRRHAVRPAHHLPARAR